MHPAVTQASEGRCPECGMTLVVTRNRKLALTSDVTAVHAGHVGDGLKTKFWVSLIFTLPIVFIAGPVAFIPIEAFPSWIAYVPLAFGSAVFFYGGSLFLLGSLTELRGKAPGMMTLIAVAITTSFLYSVAAVVMEKETLFWELSTLITIMLLGHWLEARAIRASRGALIEISKLLPETAEIIRARKTQVVALSALVVGDVVLVKPGGSIPADGTVIEGTSTVDEALITGESKPVNKQAGDNVVAGSLNGDGSLKVKVARTGDQTFLAGVRRLVEQAQHSKSRMQLISDRAARALTVIAILVGGATFGAWMLLGVGMSTAVERLVAVLVVACPHALGLAVPLVASLSTTLAARRGFIIKDRFALESARRIQVVLFDKTGTLTAGEFTVEKLLTLPAVDSDELLRLAASVEHHSEHFAAKAIGREAARRRVRLVSIERFERLGGRGVRARVGGADAFIGGELILTETGARVPDELQPHLSTAAQQGKTIVYVVVARRVLGAFVLADEVRSQAREAIASLKRRNIRVAMVTGDSEEVARWASKQLGIDEFFARVMPGDKAEKVKLLQRRGLKVAFVGDGVNDAPALAQADVGIAIGAGTNVAIEAAGIVLVKNDPRDVAAIVELSRRTYMKMRENLLWASVYNVVALPIAAGVLVPYGITLAPAFSAVAMSLSTIIVAGNALLLKRVKLG